MLEHTFPHTLITRLADTIYTNTTTSISSYSTTTSLLFDRPVSLFLISEQVNF